MLSHLWPCADFDRVSSRVLSLASLQQLSEAVELLRTKVRAALLVVVAVGGVTRPGCTLQGVGEHPVDVSSAKARHPSGDASWACRSVGDSHSSSMSERRQQRGSLPHDSPQRKPSRPVRRQQSLSDAQVRARAALVGGCVCTVSPSIVPCCAAPGPLSGQGAVLGAAPSGQQ